MGLSTASWLYITFGLGVLFSGIILLETARFLPKSIPGGVHWAVGNILLAFGLILASLRHLIPEFIPVLIGNSIIIVGSLFYFYSFGKVLNTKANLLAGYLALAFMLLGQSYFLFVDNNYGARMIIFSMAVIVTISMNLSLFYPLKKSFEAGAPRLVLICLITTIVLFLFQILFVLQNYGQPASYYQESPPIIASLVMLTVTVLLWTFTFMLLSNIKNYREIQELAYLDELTQTLNRRAILDFGNASVSNSKRNKIPFSVLMLDVDHLKQINDTYGHRAGDQAIQLVASTIKNNLRAEDAIGRYGGDEFLIILRNNNLRGAVIVAQRLIKEVEKQFDQENYEFGAVAISIGISQFAAMDQILVDLIDQADQALYKAKEFSGSSFHEAEIDANWPTEFI